MVTVDLERKIFRRRFALDVFASDVLLRSEDFDGSLCSRIFTIYVTKTFIEVIDELLNNFD